MNEQPNQDQPIQLTAKNLTDLFVEIAITHAMALTAFNHIKKNLPKEQRDLLHKKFVDQVPKSIESVIRTVSGGKLTDHAMVATIQMNLEIVMASGGLDNQKGQD